MSDNENKPDHDSELEEFLANNTAEVPKEQPPKADVNTAIRMDDIDLPSDTGSEIADDVKEADDQDTSYITGKDEGPKVSEHESKEQVKPIVDNVNLQTAPPVPKNEELVKEVEKEDDEPFVAGDLSDYIKMHSNNIMDATLAIDAIFANAKNRKDVKEIQERFSTPGTYENGLLQMRNSPTLTDNAMFLHDALVESIKAQHDLKNSIDVLNDTIITNDPKFKGELSGSAARVAFAARRKGIKKVHCLNSGFYMVIQPASIQQLHSFYREVQDEAEGNGRDIGGHFLIMEDIFLKKKFMDILPRFVIDSNLKNWDRRGAISKALDIQDYDTVIWAACCLLFKGDIKLPVICTNVKCGHEITRARFDFNRFKLVDTTIFNSKALDFCDSKEVRTLNDLKEYKKDILGFDEVIEHDGYRFHMSTPSCHDFIEYGEGLRRIIMSEIHDADASDLENSTVAAINHSRSYAPWIRKVEELDETGNVDLSTADRETICNVLDECVESESPFTAKAKDYVSRTRIAHIAYSSTNCPKCNHEPNGSIETDFIAWDAQDLFFHLSCRKIDLMRQATN